MDDPAAVNGITDHHTSGPYQGLDESGVRRRQGAGSTNTGTSSKRSNRSNNKRLFHDRRPKAEPMSNTKMTLVFVLIIGCFAILYPRIFHPMIKQMLGLSPKRNMDDSGPGFHPHERFQSMPRGGEPQMRDHPGMRPHPGMHMANERRQMNTQQGGGRSSVMTMVLPIYAVGIVLYLVYTLVKIFSKGSQKEDYWDRSRGFTYKPKHHGGGDDLDYPDNDLEEEEDGVDDDDDEQQPEAEVDPTSQQTQSTEMSPQAKAKNLQKQLSHLVMKAENNDITAEEMLQLQQRLIETEKQMAQIMQALQQVQNKIPDAFNEHTKQQSNSDAHQYADDENLEEEADNSGDELVVPNNDMDDVEDTDDDSNDQVLDSNEASTDLNAVIGGSSESEGEAYGYDEDVDVPIEVTREMLEKADRLSKVVEAAKTESEQVNDHNQSSPHEELIESKNTRDEDATSQDLRRRATGAKKSDDSEDNDSNT